MATAMLHKEAGEIQEKVTVHAFLDQEVWERLPGRSEAHCEGALGFSRQGRFLAAGLHGGRVGIWDLDTMPHLTLTLGLPDKLNPPRAGDGGEEGAKGDDTKTMEEEATEYEVVGLSWAADAKRLLVTLREDHDHQACHFCLWDVIRREVLYCLAWSSACGLPKLLTLDEPRCVLCTGAEDITFLDLQTGVATNGEQAIVEEGEGGAKREMSKSKHPGACVLAEGGRVVYCVINRRLLKFDCTTHREIARSTQVFGHFSLQVTGLFMNPDDRLLMICTSRGGFLVDSEGMSQIASFGGQGVEVDWADWTFGYDNTIIGIPTPITYNSKQERMFVWNVRGATVKGPEIKMVPQEGMSAIAISPRRPMIVGISQRGGLWMHRETLSTSFPGAMYPKGYTVLDNNIVYQEREDELDKSVRRVGRGVESIRKRADDEAAAAAVARLKEAEELELTVVDIVGGSETEDEKAEGEGGRRRWYGWGGEEHVSLLVEIQPLVDDSDEKNAANEEDQQEGCGGIPGLLPMPRTSKRVDRMPPRKGDVASEAGRKAIRAALERVVRRGLGSRGPQQASASSSVASLSSSGEGGAGMSGGQYLTYGHSAGYHHDTSKRPRTAVSTEDEQPQTMTMSQLPHLERVGGSAVSSFDGSNGVQQGVGAGAEAQPMEVAEDSTNSGMSARGYLEQRPSASTSMEAAMS